MTKKFEFTHNLHVFERISIFLNWVKSNEMPGKKIRKFPPLQRYFENKIHEFIQEII